MRLNALMILAAAIFSVGAKAQQAPALPTNLMLPESTYEIPFVWQADSVNSSLEPHGVMLIPVKLKNSPRQFYMQFDTGSPYSMLYTSTINAIREKYPEALPAEQQSGKLLDVLFTAGKMPVHAKEIALQNYSQAAINWSDKKAVIVIGTIGTDLFDGKVLTINYPHEKLTLSSKVPDELNSRLQLSDFIFVQRNIILPATLNSKKIMLYFDSGSSRYQLLTDQKTSELMATPNAVATKSNVRSWDKILTAYTLPTGDSISVASSKLPLHFTTYMAGVSASKEQQMMKMGIGGLTGNKLFLNHILVLDTRNKKFGVLEVK
jgi:hypothetical protein